MYDLVLFSQAIYVVKIIMFFKELSKGDRILMREIHKVKKGTSIRM